jgi:hypothetical protein
VGELPVEVGVRHVAAGRHVEIVNGDAARGARVGSEAHRDVAGVVALAEIHRLRVGEGEPRQDGDAVIALLPRLHHVGIPERLQRFQRKAVVRAFGLLQAQNVWLGVFEEAPDLLDPQTDRIDVPCGDGEPHAWLLGDPASWRKRRGVAGPFIPRKGGGIRPV